MKNKPKSNLAAVRSALCRFNLSRTQISTTAQVSLVGSLFVSMSLIYSTSVQAQVPPTFAPSLPQQTAPGLPSGVTPPTQGATQTPIPQPISGGGGPNFPVNSTGIPQPTPSIGTGSNPQTLSPPPPSQIISSPEPRSVLYSAGQTSVSKPKLVVSTSEGDFVMELNPLTAPQNVYSFLELALGRKEFVDIRSGRKVTRPFYTGLSCHRVIRGTLIQCGCPFGTGRGGPGFTVVDEFSPGSRFNRPGIVAMAPQQVADGSSVANRRDSNGSQFFISLAPLPEFDDRFTIIGEIVEGWDVIKKIAMLPTSPTDRPIKRVIIFGMENFQAKAKEPESPPISDAISDAGTTPAANTEPVRAQPVEPPKARPVK